MLCYLELYGAPRLLLDNRRSISNPAAQAYFVDAQIDQITRAKFAIYRQIEEGKVSPHLGDLQSHANGPNVLGQKRFLFCPTSNPLFHGKGRLLQTERVSMTSPPPTRPPFRSMASKVL